MPRPRRHLTVTSLEQLEELAELCVAADEREAISAVLRRFPVRLTPHLLELMRGSPAVARQFLPDAREVTSSAGEERCFTGLLDTGLSCLERVYSDRCIIMPQPACPAYCRFCFRKFYDRGDDRAAPLDELDAALAYVAGAPAIHEVLITGGEPLLDQRRLARLLSGLREITHVGPIRVACRSLVTAPYLIDEAAIALLARHQDLRRGRPVEVALHCNHADELAPPTIDALARLREAGLHVYNQAVLLTQVNTNAETLLQLGRALRGAGVETYYLFFCGPVLGMSHLRPTLAEAVALKSELRARGSGRGNPHLIVTTRVGKIELGVDGWIVEREPDGRHVWLRTPYRLDAFRAIDPRFTLPPGVRVDDDGNLMARYLDPKA